MSVDVQVPEGIPHGGLLTSDQGIIKIGDYDIIKVSRATVRLMNNVGVYRESGKRTGTTYAGNQRVTGQPLLWTRRINSSTDRSTYE